MWTVRTLSVCEQLELVQCVDSESCARVWTVRAVSQSVVSESCVSVDGESLVSVNSECSVSVWTMSAVNVWSVRAGSVCGH